MNTQEITEINYKFARNILSRAVLRNPALFYEKYISGGSSSFIYSLKSAWVNAAKSFGRDTVVISDVDLSLEITHVYENGDFILMVSLPFSNEGCDMIGFYIRENNDSMDFSEGIDDIYDVNISYYIFYKTTHLDKYTLLEVNKDMTLKSSGYISASEDLLIRRLYKIETKRAI